MSERSEKELKDIKLLGNQGIKYKYDYDPSVLETFENKHQGNEDLIKLLDPKYIEVWGKFTPRGGISIDPYCNYGRKGTKWEEVAEKRLFYHDMYPEKVDNR